MLGEAVEVDYRRNEAEVMTRKEEVLRAGRLEKGVEESDAREPRLGGRDRAVGHGKVAKGDG